MHGMRNTCANICLQTDLSIFGNTLVWSHSWPNSFNFWSNPLLLSLKQKPSFAFGFYTHSLTATSHQLNSPSPTVKVDHGSELNGLMKRVKHCNKNNNILTCHIPHPIRDRDQHQHLLSYNCIIIIILLQNSHSLHSLLHKYLESDQLCR